MLSHRTGAQVLGLGLTTQWHTAQRIFIETGSKMHGTQPLTECLQGCYGACRGGLMQHTGYELLRITVPRTPVNRARRRLGAAMSPGPHCRAPSRTLAIAVRAFRP